MRRECFINKLTVPNIVGQISAQMTKLVYRLTRGCCLIPGLKGANGLRQRRALMLT